MEADKVPGYRGEPRNGSEGEGPPGVPGWVKVTGLVAAVLLVIVVLVAVLGSGEHGPSRHADAGAIDSATGLSGGAAG